MKDHKHLFEIGMMRTYGADRETAVMNAIEFRCIRCEFELFAYNPVLKGNIPLKEMDLVVKDDNDPFPITPST